MSRRCALLLALTLAAASPALANDSTAALGAGGLTLVRNEEIDLLSEDLSVSAKDVRVTYHFRNHTDAAVTYLVAFPLPLIDATTPEETEFVLPDGGSDNFVDFATTVDGAKIDAKIEQRAYALGIDRTDMLKAHSLPLNPVADGLYENLQKISADERGELNRLGLVLVDPDNVQAAWKLQTTYYWEQTFPPGKEVVVEHSYKPVVGFSFFGKDQVDDASYKAKYCVDNGFRKAARDGLTAVAKNETPYYDESRISYILTTANNWAAPIKAFHLVVDKGDTDALVSFCGDGVKKTGPTTFELSETDFTPDRELEILIVKPHKDPQ